MAEIGFKPLSAFRGFKPLFMPIPATPPPRKQNPFATFVGDVQRNFRTLVASFAKRPKLFFVTLAAGTVAGLTGGILAGPAVGTLAALAGSTAGGLVAASPDDWKAYHEELRKAHSWNQKLAAFLRSPYTFGLPGAWTASLALEGKWGQIVHNPLLVAVDTAPYSRYVLKGSLRTFLMRTHGEEIVQRLAREHATQYVDHANITYRLATGRDIPAADRQRFIEVKTEEFTRQYRTHLKTATLLREAQKVLDEKLLDRYRAENFSKDPTVVLKGWDRLAEGLSWIYLRARQPAIFRRQAREFFRYVFPGREQDLIVNRVNELYRQVVNWKQELGISPEREAEILRHIAMGQPIDFSPAERTFIVRVQRFMKDLQDMLVQTGLYREYDGEIYYLGGVEKWEGKPHPRVTFDQLDRNHALLRRLEQDLQGFRQRLEGLDPASDEARMLRARIHRIERSVPRVVERIQRWEAQLPLPARMRPLAASIIADRLRDAHPEVPADVWRMILEDYQHEIYHGVVPLEVWATHIKAGKLREYGIKPRDLYQAAREANEIARRLVEEHGYNPILIFNADIRSRNVMPRIFPVDPRHAGLLNPNRTRISRAYGSVQLALTSEMTHTLRTVLGSQIWEQMKAKGAVRQLKDLVADPDIQALARKAGFADPADFVRAHYDRVALNPDTGNIEPVVGRALPGLGDWYTHRSFRRALESYNRTFQPGVLARTLQVAGKLFRITALYLSPTYWISNLLGDQIMYSIKEPVRYFRGLRALMNLEGHLGRKVVTAVRDAQGEKMFKDFFTQVDPTHFMIDVSVGRSLGSLFNRLSGKWDTVAKFAYGLGESIMYLGYTEEIQRLGISRDAARHIGFELARDVVYRLDELGPFERGILRTAFPFYGWYKYVLRYMASLPFDHPYVIPILVRTAEQVTEEERKGIPLKLFLRFSWGDSPDGKRWAIAASNVLPWASQTTARLGTTMGFLYTINPLIRAIIDASGGGRVPFADDLHWDPVSGRLTASRPFVSAVLRALVPSWDFLSQTLGLGLLSDEATQARLERFAQRHPDRWRDAIFQALGSPVFQYDQVREVYYSQLRKVRAGA